MSQQQQRIVAVLRRTSARLATATLLVAAAACGGGGGDGDGDDDDPRSTPLAPLSQDQAQDLTARTAHAVFVYDGVVSTLLWSAIGQVHFGGLSPAQPTRRYALDCASGTGWVDYADADESASITSGDSAVVVLEDCLLAMAGSRSFTGSAALSVVAGTNIQDHLFASGAGDASLLVTLEGPLASADAEELLGRYSFDSRSLAGTGLRQRIRMPDLRVNGGAAPIGFVDVDFEVSPDLVVESMSGRVRTTVAGLPAVEAVLSLVEPLEVPLDETMRFRPRTGTLRIDAGNDRRIDTTWLARDSMLLRVDDDGDGAVELEVATDPAALDDRLRSDEPVPR